MCGGGYFRDSVVLVAGATGSGKSLLASSFLVEGLARGERALFIGFEESAGQVLRNLRNWSNEIGDAVESGRLEIVCRYPESAPSRSTWSTSSNGSTPYVPNGWWSTASRRSNGSPASRRSGSS
jgi:KaiC/GvpD/RAD55 family RecA-like ATPase